MPVIRMSLARFDADALATVEALLEDSKNALEPVIRRLNGNISYVVGIDRENLAMTNVSAWESLQDAEQMASMKGLAELAAMFTGIEVRFERPITNHSVLWSLAKQK